jgi:hypothetical protein
MSEDHIGVQINGVLYVKFEDAKKLREGWDKADAEIEKLRAENKRLRAAFQKYFGQSEATNVRAALGEKE